MKGRTCPVSRGKKWKDQIVSRRGAVQEERYLFPSTLIHLPPACQTPRVSDADKASRELSLQPYLAGPGLHPSGRAAAACLRPAPGPREAARSRSPGSRHPLAPSDKAAGPALESLPPALPCIEKSCQYLLERPGPAGRDVEPNGPYQTGLQAGEPAAPAPGSRSSQNTRNMIQSIFHVQWTGQRAA